MKTVSPALCGWMTGKQTEFVENAIEIDLDIEEFGVEYFEDFGNLFLDERGKENLHTLKHKVLNYGVKIHRWLASLDSKLFQTPGFAALDSKLFQTPGFAALVRENKERFFKIGRLACFNAEMFGICNFEHYLVVSRDEETKEEFRRIHESIRSYTQQVNAFFAELERRLA